MTEKTTDSTQPGSDAHVENLTEVTPEARDRIELEEADRDDPPVADLARELTPEEKEAMRLEGDWSGDGDVNHADDAQATEDALRNNG
ncbi:MAG: hypothetical protein AAGF78_11960 [Pseudomonadota bacterium]